MKKLFDIRNIAILCCAVAFVLSCAVLFSLAMQGDIVVSKNEGQAQSYSWYFKPREDGLPPDPNEYMDMLKNGYYLGDTSQKVIYLTFDAGYENGGTSKILDILKKEKVPATFFLVGHYLDSNPELVNRMVAEGHIVGNHTYSHSDLSQIYDFEKFKEKLTKFEDKYTQVTGKQLSKYMRPPEGKFNEKTTEFASKMGYKTIFWSFAYKDWVDDAQPDLKGSIDKIISRTHPGEIALLHSTSNTNTQILEEVIKKWKQMGYSFKSLDDLK